jgi:inner membrane protein
MLLFGHLGITAGIFKVCDIVADGANNRCDPDCETTFRSSSINLRYHCLSVTRLTRSILATVDYRAVLLGSMLPDIFDKPTWLFAFGGMFPTGRGYAHSLLFNLILLTAALVLFRYKKSWLLTVSFSSVIHLLLDQIWKEPVVLLWPLFGRLPESETAGWYSYIIEVLFSDPSVYIPEIVGFAVLLFLAFRLAVRRESTNFIKTGAIR